MEALSRKELLALQTELTVLRNIVPGALERVGRLLSQSAPARPAKQKKAVNREAGLTARLLTGTRKPIAAKKK